MKTKKQWLRMMSVSLVSSTFLFPIASNAQSTAQIFLSSTTSETELVLLKAGTVKENYSFSGDPEAKEYYSFPKQVKLTYRVTSEGRNVQIMIPPPGLYASAKIPKTAEIPAGLVPGDKNDVLDQFDLEMKPELSQYIASLDPQSLITYRNHRSMSDTTTVKAHDFSFAQFLSAAHDNFSIQRGTYLILSRPSALNSDELKILLNGFKIVIHNIVTQLEPKKFTQAFPGPEMLGASTSKNGLSFVKAMAMIDEMLNSEIQPTSELGALNSQIGEDHWRAEYIRQALDHYFVGAHSKASTQNSCSTYQVKARSAPSSSVFSFSYYSPKIEELNLSFVPSQEE